MGGATIESTPRSSLGPLIRFFALVGRVAAYLRLLRLTIPHISTTCGARTRPASIGITLVAYRFDGEVRPDRSAAPT
jgi:hypothetical protein